MINSSFLSIETPVKASLRRKEEVTPVKSVNLSKRFKPSLTIKRQLTQLLRIHNFQFHVDIKFVPLKELGISVKLRNGLSEFFKQSVDIPDTVRKHEEFAMDSKYFDSFIRDYIAEEFMCQTEYSFSIISVLHYIHLFGVSLDDALCELFEFSTSHSLCQMCVTGDDQEERKELANRHNFLLLKSLLKEKEVKKNDVFDICASDDSLNDPACDLEKLESTSEEVTSCSSNKDTVDQDKSRMDNEEDFCFNPFVTGNKHSSSEDVFSFNPFTVASDVNEVLNSTIAFNPFTESDTFKGIEDIKDCSPVGHVKERKIIVCDHCGKGFLNRYNMKQHLISVHKIYPKGMSVFKCDFPNCSFTSGNQILFNRHVHKQKKVPNKRINSFYTDKI